MIRGVLDVLNVELGLRHEDVIIGRNTGSQEFPGHLRTLGKFRKLSDFIFVLDGDSRPMENRLKAVAERLGHSVQPLFLPGDGPPEQWLWDALREKTAEYEAVLGRPAADLERSLRDVEQLVGGAVRQGDASKAALDALADSLGRTVPEIARIVGHREAEQARISEFMVELKEQIGRWRQL